MTTADNDRRRLAIRLYDVMLHIRRFEEAAELAQRGGEIPGTLHLSIGQEAVAAGICSALRPTDLITSTHRGHGHCIAKGASLNDMMAELFGRETGTCSGKGGSMHIADFSVGMLGANGVVGGGMGIAVGAAHGLRVRGAEGVVACFFGDGAVNRGPFVEALNWASVFRLPVLFVCEDNSFAAFTETAQVTAGGGPAVRAEALGIRNLVVDGNDALAVAEAAADFVSAIRDDRAPAFVHARTYRLRGHTIADKGAYRDAKRHASQERRDPVLLMERCLEDWQLAQQAADIRRRVEHDIAAALAAARDGPQPDPGRALTEVQSVGAPA